MNQPQPLNELFWLGYCRLIVFLDNILGFLNIYFSALSDLIRKILLQPIVWSSVEILTFTEIFSSSKACYCPTCARSRMTCRVSTMLSATVLCWTKFISYLLCKHHWKYKICNSKTKDSIGCTVASYGHQQNLLVIL